MHKLSMRGTLQLQGLPVRHCCCIIVMAAMHACASRGNLHVHAHHQPQHVQHTDLDAITEEPVHALFDFTAALVRVACASACTVPCAVHIQYRDVMQRQQPSSVVQPALDR